MPPPVATLSSIPAELRMQLHEKLITNGFGDLEQIAAWLVGEGVNACKSTVDLYARRFKRAQEIDLAVTLPLESVPHSRVTN